MQEISTFRRLAEQTANASKTTETNDKLNTLETELTALTERIQNLSSLAENVEASLKKNMGETHITHQAITTNTQTAHALSRHMQQSIREMTNTAESLADYTNQAQALTAQVAQMTATIAELNQAITDLPNRLAEQGQQATAQAEQALTEITDEMKKQMEQRVTEIMTPIIDPINSLMAQLHRETEIHAHRNSEQDRLLTQTQSVLDQQQAQAESLNAGQITAKIMVGLTLILIPFLAWVLAIISWAMTPIWGMILMTIIAIGMTAGAIYFATKN